LTDGLSDPPRLRRLVDWYLEEGGHGPLVLTRSVWHGESDPARIEAEATRYALYAPAQRRAAFANFDTTIAGSAAQVAGGLLRAIAETGATALSLRLSAVGVPASEVLEQIAVIGAEVLPEVRAGWEEVVSRTSPGRAS
jgi:hypothetical protein